MEQVVGRDRVFWLRVVTCREDPWASWPTVALHE